MILLAAFEFWDILIMVVLIIALTGGGLIASRRPGGGAANEERLRRVEDKLNVILSHLGIDYVPATKERWQRLAETNKLQAVKEYRAEHPAVSLAEAKSIVEQYLAESQNK